MAYPIASKFLLLLLFTLFFISACNKQETPLEEEEIEITPADYTPEYFNSFIFIGVNKRTPSLYRYKMSDDKSEEFWKAGKEKILELSLSPDRKSAFFITAKSSGIRGVFPYINDIKLYVINDTNVTFVQNAGDAIQISVRWETSNAFRIFINKMNPSKPSEITQISRIYNTYGKLFEESERVFNLLVEGYPPVIKEPLSLNSADNKYSIKIKQGETDSLFISFNEVERSAFIKSTVKAINSISWSADLMYSLIELVDKENPSGSDLILYSIKDRKIIEEWKENTPGSFLLVNNLIVFDKGRREKSKIIVYDLDQRKEIKALMMKGGCSLRTLRY